MKSRQVFLQLAIILSALILAATTTNPTRAGSGIINNKEHTPHFGPDQGEGVGGIYLPIVRNNYPVPETGKIVFVSDRDGNDEIYSMNYDGSGVTRLTDNTAQDGSPDWSPDGSKIAFSSNLTGDFEIYVMNSDGSGLVQVTTLGDCFQPQWSPDGTHIAFVWQGYDSIVYTIHPDGTGLFQVTYPPEIQADSPYWTPDGSKIAFISPVPTPGIYTENPDGTGLTPVLEVSGLAYFAWSPDGNRIVLSLPAPPNYNFDLYLYDLSTQVTTRLTNTQFTHNSVDWSPDGNYLVFHSWMGGFPVNFEIYSLSVDGYNLKNLSNNPAADSAPDWTR